MIGAIILAAGSSKRFGTDKRKALLPNGTSVIQQTIMNTCGYFDESLLVLRSDDEDFVLELRSASAPYRIKTLLAPDSSKGMGHSLANAILNVSDWQAAFIFLGDMPHISARTLAQLKKAASDRLLGDPSEPWIIIPTCHGHYGHPVGFHCSFFFELAKLSGDTGARTILKRHSESCFGIETNDEGILKDIDQPEDLTNQQS